MKRICLTTILFLFSLTGFSGDKSGLLYDDPDPRMPQRESSQSEEAELLLDSGNASHQSVEGRQIKQNQEEVDPIFYDFTTSPAELDKAD